MILLLIIIMIVASVFADGLLINIASGRTVRFACDAQPAREYDERLEQHEGDDQQRERVCVPIDSVRVIGAVEADLASDVAVLRLKLELVFDPDLLEHYFVRLVADWAASTAAPSVNENEIK